MTKTGLIKAQLYNQFKIDDFITTDFFGLNFVCVSAAIKEVKTACTVRSKVRNKFLQLIAFMSFGILNIQELVIFFLSTPSE